jgi:hypothetical protein
MKDYVLNKKPEPAANKIVWAFDLGKGSLGEALRRGPEFPPETRWHTIKAKAKSPEIGKVIDDAMGAIERESDVAQASPPAGSGGVPAASQNPGRGRPANPQPGTAALRSKDVLGRVYEYSLGKFASAFGHICGEPSEASWTTGTVARRASASDSASQFYTGSDGRDGQAHRIRGWRVLLPGTGTGFYTGPTP